MSVPVCEECGHDHGGPTYCKDCLCASMAMDRDYAPRGMADVILRLLEQKVITRARACGLLLALRKYGRVELAPIIAGRLNWNDE